MIHAWTFWLDLYIALGSGLYVGATIETDRYPSGEWDQIPVIILGMLIWPLLGPIMLDLKLDPLSRAAFNKKP